MPTIRGRIESTKFIKSGQGAKGPWTMFEVMVNGQKFTGFGDYWQKNTGKEADYEYKEEQRTSPKGTTYMSRTINAPKSGGTVNPQQLQSIEKKLDEVLSILRSQQQPEVPRIPSSEELYGGPEAEEEVNVDDIPF